MTDKESILWEKKEFLCQRLRELSQLEVKKKKYSRKKKKEYKKKRKKKGRGKKRPKETSNFQWKAPNFFLVKNK